MREHVVMQNGVTLIVLLIILFIFLTPLALRLELLEEINYQRVGLIKGLPKVYPYSGLKIDGKQDFLKTA